MQNPINQKGSGKITRGWHGEKQRHSLAARGVKTTKIYKNSKSIQSYDNEVIRYPNYKPKLDSMGYPKKLSNKEKFILATCSNELEQIIKDDYELSMLEIGEDFAKKYSGPENYKYKIYFVEGSKTIPPSIHIQVFDNMKEEWESGLPQKRIEKKFKHKYGEDAPRIEYSGYPGSYDIYYE